MGLSIFSDTYEYYAPEKGSERHHRMLLNKLENALQTPKVTKQTDTITFLHQIAEKMHRRAMIVLFTDMFQPEDDNRLFKALQHLKHNKHKVVLFHVVDKKTEINLEYDSNPRKFIDIETGDEVNIYAQNIKKEYEKAVNDYFKKLENTCLLYKIKYVPVSVGENFEKIMTTYLLEKQNFG